MREDNGKNQGIHSEGTNIKILRVAKKKKNARKLPKP